MSVVWNMKPKLKQLRDQLIATLPEPEVQARASSTYTRADIVHRLEMLDRRDDYEAVAERTFLQRLLEREDASDAGA